MPWQGPKVLFAVEQDVVEANESRVVAQHLLGNELPAEPLLQRVEARRRAAMLVRALGSAFDEQFPVDHGVAVEALRDFGKAPGDVVAGAAVKACLAADAHDLDANA